MDIVTNMVTHIVGVRVSGEDWTCSLTSVGASILDEEHTWSLRFTRVPLSGEDYSWSATPQPTPVFSFSSPLHHASEKVAVKGRIMSRTRQQVMSRFKLFTS